MARLELEVDPRGVRRGTQIAKLELEGVVRKARQTEQALEKTGRTGNRFGGQLQNAALQVGDFATQVGSGTSAVVALNQQLPQLLGGFGVAGAVFGAATAAAIPLASALFRAGEGTASFRDQIGDIESATGDLESSLRTLTDLQQAYVDSVVEGSANAVGAIGREIEARGQLLELRRLDVLDQIDSARAALEASRGQIDAIREEAATIAGNLDQDSANAAFVRTQGISAAAQATQDLVAENELLFREFRQQTLELELAETRLGQIDSLIAQATNTASGLSGSFRQAADEAGRIASNLAAAISAANAGGDGVGRSRGPGGPLIGSTELQLLNQGIVPTDPATSFRTAVRGGGGGGGGGSTVDTLARQAEQAAQAYERLRSGLDPLFAAQTRYNGAIETLDEALARGQIGQEEFNVTLGLAEDRFREAQQGATAYGRVLQDLERFTSLETLIEGSGAALQNSLSDFLFDPFQDGLQGMVLAFSDALRRMAADAVAAQIGQLIFGTATGTGGGGGGFLSFLGLNDAGGYIPSGSAGIVAERRPERVNGLAVNSPAVIQGPARIQGGAMTARETAAAPVVNNKTVLAFNRSEVAAAVTSEPEFETRVIEILFQQGVVRG